MTRVFSSVGWWGSVALVYVVFGGPRCTQAAPSVFVTDIFEDTLSEIDTVTNVVTNKISIGDAVHPAGVAVTPDGKFAYVANEVLGTVTVIDLRTQLKLATLRTGPGVGVTNAPRRILASPDGSRVYAFKLEVGIVTIDVATHAVAEIIPMLEGETVHVERATISPDGRSLFLLGYGSRANAYTRPLLAVFDTQLGTVTSIVAAESGGAFAVSPDGRYAYVARVNGPSGDGRVDVVDVTTGAVLKAIPFARAPVELMLSGDGSSLIALLSSYYDRVVLHVVNTGTGAVQSITVAELGSAAGVVLSPDERTAYVVYERFRPLIQREIATVDLSTAAVVATMPLHSEIKPQLLAMLPDGQRMVVAAAFAVGVLTVATGEVQTILQASYADRIAVAPDESTVFLASTAIPRLMVVDRVSHQVRSIRLPGPANDVAVSPNGALVYVGVSFGDGGGIAIIDVDRGRVDATIPVSPQGTFGLVPASIVFAPDSLHALVLAGTRNDRSFLALIDTADRLSLMESSLRAPQAVTATPDGCFAWVATRFPGTKLEILDLTSFASAGSIDLRFNADTSLTRITFSADGARAYVPTYDTQGVAIESIDVALREVTGAVEGLPYAQGFVFTPDLAFGYAPDVRDEGVRVFDATTGAPVTTVKTGPNPQAIGIGARSGHEGGGPCRRNSPTPTPIVTACAGDCNDDRHVSIAELLRVVDASVSGRPPTNCPLADADHDGAVTVEDTLRAVESALGGCPSS